MGCNRVRAPRKQKQRGGGSISAVRVVQPNRPHVFFKRMKQMLFLSGTDDIPCSLFLTILTLESVREGHLKTNMRLSKHYFLALRFKSSVRQHLG